MTGASPPTLTRAEIERGVIEAVTRAFAERREERHTEIVSAVSAGVTQALHSVERTERKEALKDAFKELMQEQLARLGGWTLAGIGSLVVGTLLFGVLYILAIKAGWTPPHQ